MSPKLCLSLFIAALSFGCVSRPGTYGYVGAGDKAIVEVLRRHHMSTPKGIEKYLRAELYRGRDPANGLTADYLTRRGMKCEGQPVVKCSLKGEASLHNTTLQSGSTQGPYQKTSLLVEIYLAEQPQRVQVTRTDVLARD